MNLLLQTNHSNLKAQIAVTGSKSETNRLLLLQALFPNITLSNTSNSDDSEVMQKALKGNNEIVDIIVDQLDLSRELITYVDDRLGHDKRYAIDPKKLETELGWKPKYTFDSGIIETIKWYQENEEWWRPLKERAGL